MSSDERGALHTIELEYWVNGSVPVDLDAMSRILGLPKNELEEGLTKRVKKYLKEVDSPEGRVYIVPELEQYRIAVYNKRALQSEAGRRTAEKRATRRVGDSSATSQAGSSVSSQARSSASRYASSSLRGEEAHGIEVSGTEQKGVVFSKEVSMEHQEFLTQNDGDPEFMRQQLSDPGHVSKGLRPAQT
jgi:hypothetical protein